jgi:hypothetical protein
MMQGIGILHTQESTSVYLITVLDFPHGLIGDIVDVVAVVGIVPSALILPANTELMFFDGVYYSVERFVSGGNSNSVTAADFTSETVLANRVAVEETN